MPEKTAPFLQIFFDSLHRFQAGVNPIETPPVFPGCNYFITETAGLGNSDFGNSGSKFSLFLRINQTQQERLQVEVNID